MGVYFVCLQSNTRQATFGCNPIVPSRSTPVKLKEMSRERGQRFSLLITFGSKGLNGSVKHTHKLHICIVRTSSHGLSRSLFLWDSLKRQRGHTLTGCHPQRRLPLSGSDSARLRGENAGVHEGHITPVHMGPCSIGSRPAVNPLTSPSSVPNVLSVLRMGRLIGPQIPHNTTSWAYRGHDGEEDVETHRSFCRENL